MGNRANDALALQASKYWINQDYSDSSAVQKAVDELNIDFVVPGCTDVSIETSQQLRISNKDKFDTPEQYEHLSKKDKFRVLCNTLDIPSPKVVTKDDLPTQNKLIAKPTDAYSGLGISVFDGCDMQAFEKAELDANRYSKSSSSVVETYIEGQLHSFSCFIENQKISSFFIVKEGSSANEFAVDTSYVCNEVSSNIVNSLAESIEKIAKHLKLSDGLLHVQYIEADEIAYLIELTRRCPGDLYPLLISLSTDFDFAGKYASYFLNKSYEARMRYQKNIVRHTISSPTKAFFNGVRFKSNESIKAFYPISSLGTELLPMQKTRVGIVFSEVENKEIAYQSFLSRTKYNLK